MTPAFGLNRLDLGSVANFAASAQLAESLGWQYGFIPSSPLLVRDPYVMLAAAALQTRTLRLGPLIENPVMRHPATIAGSIATVEELAPSRTVLGLGIGDTAVRLMAEKPATVRALGESIDTIHALLRGTPVNVDAQRAPRLAHRRDVPIWVAAQGPRTLETAGRVADGVFIRVGTHPRNIGTAIEHVQAGAEAAGRDAVDVAIGLIFHTVISDDPSKVALIKRSMAAGYAEYSPSLLATAGLVWDSRDLAELQGEVWPDFHHASDLAAAGELVSDLNEATADAFCVSGSWSAVRDQFHDLTARWPSAQVIIPHPVSVGGRAAPAEYMTAFAREVIAHT
jgi:alkanesulfonate monooxygenase SsuD/methylene tetrahydromethanopterin reductase-like flavin-dependent oxidoreductase (luciferase family)